MAKAPTRVMLPGILYQENVRWLWNVNLPGEDKPKARALKPDGSRCATTDSRETGDLAKIDTGQQLCSDCLKMMRG